MNEQNCNEFQTKESKLIIRDETQSMRRYGKRFISTSIEDVFRRKREREREAKTNTETHQLNENNFLCYCFRSEFLFVFNFVNYFESHHNVNSQTTMNIVRDKEAILIVIIPKKTLQTFECVIH